MTTVDKGTRIYVHTRVIGDVVAVDSGNALVLWRNGSTELDPIPLEDIQSWDARPDGVALVYEQ